MTKQEILDYFCLINEAYNESSRFESLSRMLDELLKEQQELIDKLIEENASNAEMAEGLNELLKEQEAVVRCKDCKHYNIIGCAGGFGWCERYGMGHTDDFFCADGERKEGR